MSSKERLSLARSLKGEFAPSMLSLALNVHRSSLKAALPAKRDLTGLLALIEVELLKWQRYGVRRMYHHLKRMGVHASRSEVKACYESLGALMPKPTPKEPQTTNSR